MTHNSPRARIGNPLMKPRAIVWDLFGDHLRYIDGGRIPMRVLNQLLDMFGVGESTTRVVLSRMRREGWFTTSRDGRQTSYALTGRSVTMLDEGQARIFDRGRDAWDGIWRTVIYAVPGQRAAQHGIGGVDAVQGGVGEHHAEAERVAGPVALEYGDLTARVAALGQ